MLVNYYGPNFSCTESTSYPEKKEKAGIKFMNFSQKYMGSVFLGHPVHHKRKSLTFQFKFFFTFLKL